MNRIVSRFALLGALLVSVGLASWLRADEPPAPADETASAPPAETAAAPREIPEPPEGGWDVYVVPIEGAITSPQLYILRRALKEAIANDIEIVLLEMDTPGGALDVTLEMMEALDRFSGETVTFVDDEAMSAGSYISIATDDIWFAPKGVMGAAEAVTGNGQDISESMQRKIDSYLRAKVRVLAREHRYRADVQRAMMDPDYELAIDGQVLKEPGELLSVTADEAVTLYGDPPAPLLASGIADSVTDLLDQKLGAGNYRVTEFEVTWSEEFAKWFKGIAPVLMGLGMLLLFVEFKTPGFGIFGIGGITLLLLVFASNYFAGMAGHEAVLLFLVGIILLGVEIFLLPGTLIAGLLGGLLIVGSLLWTMADIWPAGSEGFEWTPALFYAPVAQLALGFVIALFGALALIKFLPKSWLHRTIVLGRAVGGPSPALAAGGRSIDHPGGANALPEPGARGLAVTDLHPGGQVEIDGRRYQARVLLGDVESGRPVEVVDRRDFSLVVKAL